MSECQKDAVRISINGRAYALIAPIFDQLPDRFTLHDVMKAGHIPNFLSGAVTSVLERTFKCNQVAGRATWKKR